jgi:hypothetical protein
MDTWSIYNKRTEESVEEKYYGIRRVVTKDIPLVSYIALVKDIVHKCISSILISIVGTKIPWLDRTSNVGAIDKTRIVKLRDHSWVALQFNGQWLSNSIGISYILSFDDTNSWRAIKILAE